MWEWGWPVRLCRALGRTCWLCLWVRGWVNHALGRNTLLKTAIRRRFSLDAILPYGYQFDKKPPPRGRG